MENHTFHSQTLPALSLAGSGRAAHFVSRALVVGFCLLAAAILFLPWRQFVGGSGRIIAFNPLDRRVNIEAQVSGRVKHLHVVEGQRVRKGELLVEIQDNDPELLNNLRAQREAIESRRDFAQGRVESLISQITQQELAQIVQLIQEFCSEGFKHISGGRYQILVDNIDVETFKKIN